MSLSGRDWNTCLNHCLPPSKGQRRFRRQPLLLNHRPHRVRTPRLQFARQGFEILHWTFRQFSAIDPAFGCYGGCTKGQAVSKQSLSHWIVHGITEAYTTQGLENALCTLGAVQRGLSFHLSVVKMYVYSRYLLGSQLVFAEYLRKVLQAGRSVLSLPSAVGE